MTNPYDMTTPVDAYARLNNGAFWEYNVKTWTGVFHPATVEVEQQSRSATSAQFRRTALALPQHRRPEVAIVDTDVGIVPNVNVPWRKVLYMLMWKPTDGSPAYIGESGGAFNDGTPPDPELALDTYAGHQFDVYPSSVSFDPATGIARSDSIKSRYRTQSVGTPPWWATWYPDCVYNTLWERPDDPAGYVYGYLWAKNVGLVNAWWGWKDVNNKIGIAPDGSMPQTWELTRWG